MVVAGGSGTRRVVGPLVRGDEHRLALLSAHQWRAGERALELDQLPWPEAHEPAAAQRDRDVGCLGAADDRGRLAAVEHPQRDAQVRVGEDVLVDRARRALRRQHEVDAETATALGDVDDPGDELGHLLHERGELVDDDHERRWRVGGRFLEHLGEVLGAAFHHAHPAVQLCAQRGQRPQRQVGVQVRDVPDRVRQPLEHLGSGAALVVDEQEVEPGRRMPDRECGDHRLQQLALARTGRAADQGVRAVLHEVDLERASGVKPDRESQVEAHAATPLLASPTAARAGRRRARRAAGRDAGSMSPARPSTRRGPEPARVRARSATSRPQVLDLDLAIGNFGIGRPEPSDHRRAVTLADAQDLRRLARHTGERAGQPDHADPGFAPDVEQP